MSTAGSVESVSIGGVNFPVTADADVSMGLGGSTNEFESNGDGSTRQLKTQAPWMLDGVVLSIDNDRDDMDFLQDRADSEIEVPIEITYADGNVYSGAGNVSGDINYNSANGTCPVKLMGSGKLTRQ